MNRITNREKEIINYFRHNYAVRGYFKSYLKMENFAPVETFLAEWERNKRTYLFKLFGENLSISFPINTDKPEEVLYNEIRFFLMTTTPNEREDYERIFKAYGTAHITHRGAWVFYSNILSLFPYIKHGKDEPRQKLGIPAVDLYNSFVDAVIYSSTNLLNNSYNGPELTINAENGGFKVTKGMKITKILAKLAKLFDIDGYEEFRLCHSEILGGKSLSGTLTLSIHPLDYITMSENSAGWSSCMQWSSYGAYRQGSVEMMNGSDVIVAYFTSDRKHVISEDLNWNNKLWRTLIVVNKYFIASIKEYPVSKPELNKYAVNIIKELALQNLGWEYEEIKEQTFEETWGEDEGCCYISYKKDGEYKEHGLYISPLGPAMYNDFGSTSFNYMAINSENFVERIEETTTLSFTYGGYPECVVCGKVMHSETEAACEFLGINFEGAYNSYENLLACHDCSGINYEYCECCGELIPSVDSVYDEERDSVYCESCYESMFFKSDLTGERYCSNTHFRAELIPFVLVEEDEQDKAYEVLVDHLMRVRTVHYTPFTYQNEYFHTEEERREPLYDVLGNECNFQKMIYRNCDTDYFLEADISEYKYFPVDRNNIKLAMHDELLNCDSIMVEGNELFSFREQYLKENSEYYGLAQQRLSPIFVASAKGEIESSMKQSHTFLWGKKYFNLADLTEEGWELFKKLAKIESEDKNLTLEEYIRKAKERINFYVEAAIIPYDYDKYPTFKSPVDFL